MRPVLVLCALVSLCGIYLAEGKHVDRYLGDAYVTTSLLESIKQIDDTIVDCQNLYRDPKRDPVPFDFHSILGLMQPGKEARAGEIVENTIHLIMEKVKTHHGSEITDLSDIGAVISPEQLEIITSIAGCTRHVMQASCSSVSSKYRTANGTCNNLDNPLWGATQTPYQRFLRPIFENKWSTPVGWEKSREYNGFTLPSARLVSQQMKMSPEEFNDPKITKMYVQWGEFLTHDMIATAKTVGQTAYKGKREKCTDTCENTAPCFPIPVPDNDPRIDNVEDKACLPFTRSSHACGTGESSAFFNTVSPREQINKATSFIDASQVYGSTLMDAQSLRNFSTDEGLLRVQPGADMRTGMDMLPSRCEESGMSVCRQDPKGGEPVPCSLAGDSRVDANPALTSLHTVFLREHNRIARELKRINPHWDGEKLYQEARQIVGSEMQRITFAGYLPLEIGTKGMELLGEYSGYDASVSPAIRNEFSTAAFRSAHASDGTVLHRFDENYEEDPEFGNVSLMDVFYSPWRLVKEGGVDPVVRGAIGSAARKPTQNKLIHEDLTENLFAVEGKVALDLAAIDIQRGRDHALPFYNDFREYCNLGRAESFDDLASEISDPAVRQKLADVYGDVNNIELWPAGLLEDKVEGATSGPTFHCLRVQQMKNLRDGDRFWYESEDVFTPSQRQEISHVTLARVICDNTAITRIPRDVFLRTDVSDMVMCEDIPDVNLHSWAEDNPEDAIVSDAVEKDESSEQLPKVQLVTENDEDLSWWFW